MPTPLTSGFRLGVAEPPVPAMCSPTCSAGWARLVQSLRQRLIGGE